MANILNTVTEKLPLNNSSSKKSSGGSAAQPGQSDEQTFNILPHPAKSNNPADVQDPSESTGGLGNSQGLFEAFKTAPGPVQPNEDMLKDLPPPKNREELDALQAQLNKLK